MPSSFPAWLSLALATLGPAWAQDPSTFRALRRTGPIVLDGRLDEPDWKQAQVARNWLQQLPRMREAAGLPGEARVLFDDDHLYVGLRMTHLPGTSRVASPVFRRDGDAASDFCTVFLDPGLTRRSGYNLSVTPSGVQWDAALFNDTEQDPSWDGVWEAATRVDEGGWTAEFRIPLNLFPIPEGQGGRWGINFARYSPFPEEKAAWIVPPREAQAWVSRFAQLEGLESVRPRARFEVMPFVTGRRKTRTLESWDDRNTSWNGGLDAVYAAGALQAHAALRPDYGQVEVDQVVLNLSSVETFFPEKRPFFTEGMELFRLPGTRLFYSRRIGRGAGRLDVPKGGHLVEQDQEAAVQVAMKAQVHTPQGWRVGALGASTGAAEATWVDGEGRTRTANLVPRARYQVARAQRVLDARGSYLGAFGAQMREAAPGLEARVGALDGLWRTEGGHVAFQAMGSSRNTGAGSLRGSGLEVMGSSALAREWSLGWRMESLGRDFSPNDLGYLARSDVRGASATLTWTRDNPSRAWSKVTAWIAPTYREDQAGQAFERMAEAGLTLTSPTSWNTTVKVLRRGEAQDDRELRTWLLPRKTYLLRAHETTTTLTLMAPYSLRNAFLSLARTDQTGGPEDQVTLGLGFAPAPNLSLDTEVFWNHSRGRMAWWGSPGGVPVAGLRRLSQLDLRLRSTWALSPQMTLQALLQWTSASWHFRDAQRHTPDGTLAPVLPGGDALRTVNANLVYRWEYLPGAAFYAVYTRNGVGPMQDPVGTHAVPGDFGGCQRWPSNDAFQAKLTWRF